MNAEPKTEQELADEALEDWIARLECLGRGGPTREAQRLAYALLAELKTCISPERVRQIEQARGLAR